MDKRLDADQRADLVLKAMTNDEKFTLQQFRHILELGKGVSGARQGEINAKDIAEIIVYYWRSGTWG